MLHVEHLNLTIDHHEILRDIHFDVQDGEFVCLVGPSGCGKTILLYAIAGFLKPCGGAVMVDGQQVAAPGRDRAMVFQDYILFPWKSVGGNVAFGLEKVDLTPAQKSEMVDHHLQLVGLADFKDWPVSKLSGGMQQRVAIARALIMDPKILLMDEPFSALDLQYRRYMRTSIIDIWRATKKTIVFVTHSVNEALVLADRVYVLTARPAHIKSQYQISLPRPRDPKSPAFLALADIVEHDMFEEFEKIKDEQPFPYLDEQLLPIKF